MSLTISRFRGDTYPQRFTVTDTLGAAVDVTGWAFVLTVDPNENPPDALGNVASITGTITDAAGGVIEFDFQGVTIEPGSYFFDVQATDASPRIRTIVKGAMTIRQDISK